ncbi:MAG: hypothetical protein AAGA58_14580 [Verrucomicrobiota bacterium]
MATFALTIAGIAGINYTVAIIKSKSTAPHPFKHHEKLAKEAFSYLFEHGEFPKDSTLNAFDLDEEFKGKKSKHLYPHGTDKNKRFLDAWGNPYDIFYSKDEVLVRSRGPDGEIDNRHCNEADDIIYSLSLDR